MSTAASSSGGRAKRLLPWFGCLLGAGIVVGGLVLATAGFNDGRACALSPGTSPCRAATTDEFLGIILVVGGVIAVIAAVMAARAARSASRGPG